MGDRFTLSLRAYRWVAYAALGEAAAELLAMGGYPPGLEHRPGG